MYPTPHTGLSSAAPIEVTATTEGPTVISVAWRKPATTSGLINYLIVYSPVGTGDLFIIGCGTHSSKRLTRLTPNTTYQMFVRAQNVQGISVTSEVVMAMTLPISSEP